MKNLQQISPKPSQLQKSPKHMEEEEDDEMPELETDLPAAITRTIQNDRFEEKKNQHQPQFEEKKNQRQPGAYMPKSPGKIPPLEQISPISPHSPRMPELEQKTPPKRKQPLLPTPVPQMPQPGNAKVYDSRDLEEKMLLNDTDGVDESVQLFVSNFPYGTQEVGFALNLLNSDIS